MINHDRSTHLSLEDEGSRFPGAYSQFQRQARNSSRPLDSPAALIVSSNAGMLGVLYECVRRCGLTPRLALSVFESRKILARQTAGLVICDESLIDGGYGDILGEAKKSPKVPVIVISRTGDWPDYLKAVTAGAFDYMPYPLAFVDLSRSIQRALEFAQTPPFAQRLDSL